jgi:zinc protease
MKHLQKLSGIGIVLFFTLAATSFKTIAQSMDSPIPMDDSVRTGTLSNGMKYYIRRNVKPEHRAELRLAVNAGSMEENDDQQGLAHFNEHVSFDGTGEFKKNDIINFLESSGVKFGADLNAYTSFDETVYMIQVPTDSEMVFKKAFQIIYDWTHLNLFDSIEIEKERGIVISERRLGLGAFQRMRDQYWPVLFKDSRYADRLPIGKLDVLENCKHSTLKQFYLDWYRPELMAVIAVGDFDINKVEKMIKEKFSEVPSKPNSRPLVPFQVPDNKDLLIAKATDKESPYTILEIEVKHDKEHTLTLANYRRDLTYELFSSMLNSRLQELQKSATPPFLVAQTNIGGLVRTKDDFSAFGLVKEGGVETGLYTLLTEVERVKRYGFTPGEFDRAKKDLLRTKQTAVEEKDKTESRKIVNKYVQAYLEKEPVPSADFEYSFCQRNLDGIKIEEVNNVAKEWITDNGQNTVIIIQAPQKDSASLPSDDTIRNIYNKVKKENISPYADKTSNLPLMATKPSPGKVIDEKQIKELGITEWKLSNGVKIVLKPTDFKNDEVLFNAYRWGGSSLAPDRDDMSASSAAEIEDEAGIGPFSSPTLEKMMAGQIIAVSPQMEEFSQGFNGNFSPQDMETAFQLINLYFTQPRKDDTAFHAFMDQQRGFIQNRSADPSNAFRDTVEVTMSQYNYRRRPYTVNLVNEIDENKAFDFYKQQFSDAGDFTFFFVGNFKPDNIKPLVEMYLGSLPSGNSTHAWKDVGIRPPTGVISKTVVKGKEPKSSVQITFSGPCQYTRKNTRDMEALSSLLSIKLREQLRQEMSGVYGVGARGLLSHYPKEEYRFTISFGCAPERVNELVDATYKMIDSVKQFGAGDINLRKIKETLHRQHEVDVKDNKFWLGAISQSYKDNLDLMDILNFDTWVDGLTNEDFKRLANQYLNMNNYAKFVLNPEQ